MRWSFPCPPSVPGNRAVTNIRNTASSYWRAWLKPANRCLVPVTSFCEYAPGKPAVPHWFALGEDRPDAVVALIHPKAMPVILTTPQDCDAWLTAPVEDALRLQRPLPDTLLSVVAKGEKQDGGDQPSRKFAMLLL